MSFSFGRPGYVLRQSTYLFLLSFDLLLLHLRSNFRLSFLAVVFISSVYRCEDGLNETYRFLRGAYLSKIMIECYHTEHEVQ